MALAHRRGGMFAALLYGLLWLGAAMAADDAAKLDARSWQAVDSDNFRIVSMLGEERTIELLRQLEIMHASLGATNNGPTFAASMPVVIVAVDNHDDYTSLGAPPQSARIPSIPAFNRALIRDSPVGASTTWVAPLASVT